MQVRPENWIHNKMKNRLNSRRPGVTMVELLIATGVFSLFMFSIYGVFEYSRSGFNSGSWRIQRQKQAQTFLLRLKELLERSSHAYAVAPNGATSKVADRPTVINGTWYNKVASTTNHGILYFSITTPFVPEQPELGQEKRMGIWKGVGLDCKDKTLKLYLTGVWDEMPAHTPVEVGSPDLDRFAYGNTEGVAPKKLINLSRNKSPNIVIIIPNENAAINAIVAVLEAASTSRTPSSLEIMLAEPIPIVKPTA